jgi:hypothetical protein
VNVRPATDSVPVLAAPVLAPTLKVTDPLPIPLESDVIAIHESLLWALQVQSARELVTLMGAPGPPAALMF